MMPLPPELDAIPAAARRCAALRLRGGALQMLFVVATALCFQCFHQFCAREPRVAAPECVPGNERVVVGAPALSICLPPCLGEGIDTAVSKTARLQLRGGVCAALHDTHV